MDDEHHAKNTKISESLGAIHDVVQLCGSSQKAATATSGLQRALAAATESKLGPLLACSAHATAQGGRSTRHLTATTLNIAYPTDSYDVDHAARTRKLQAAHPAAGVHARKLSPPVFKNPIMLAARKTHPTHVAADGSRRYRMLSTGRTLPSATLLSATMC